MGGDEHVPVAPGGAAPIDPPLDPVRIAVARADGLEEASGEAAFVALDRARSEAGAVVWVDLARADRVDVMRVAGPLDLHPLIVEDIEEGNQRSKVELTDGLIHLVVFALDYRDEVIATEIDIVVGRGFVLTAHDGGWDARGIPRLASAEALAATMQRGPDHLLWAMVDAIVDDYFPFVDRLGDALDALEDEVVERADPATLQKVFSLKRDLIAVRRAVSPVREILNQLTNRDLALIDAGEIVYFRDVYDHLIRLTDEIDSYRELAASTLDVYLSSVNNNLSVIMKRLTGVTVVLAGIGAAAGIFGMSEANAELGSGLGFWAITAAIVASAALTLWFLRRIRWI
jgi:magnesium transporter